MVQGQTKGLQAKGPARQTKTSTNLKKGKKHIPPKKHTLIKQGALHKELTAKINKSIEQQMVSAASSGKLTIVKNAGHEAPSSKKQKGKK